MTTTETSTDPRQDEFIYLLEGYPVLISDGGEMPLAHGMCAGAKAGTGDGQQLVDRGGEDVVYLEIGDCAPGDTAAYPDDDITAALGPDGRWRFTHKDGTPY